MDEILVAEILKRVSLVVSLIGILVGLDLVFGAKVIIAVKRFLDKAWNMDNALTNPKVRKWLGIIMLFISLAMLLLLVTAK